MPQFSPDQVLRLLDKHGLPKSTPIKGEFEGVVNEVWYCGDVVVRINKNLDYESDVWTETVAVPALRKARILTPDLIAFDPDLDIVPRLVTIYERAPGTPLSKVESLLEPEELFAQIGQCIREVHDKMQSVEDPDNKLDPAWDVDYAKARDRILDYYPAANQWLPAQLNFVPDNPPVFTHQDLHPDNILVHNGKLSVILDWGDAGWGSQSVDMRYVPSRFMESFLGGYGQVSPQNLINTVIHQVDQWVYCQANNRSYGTYGDTTIEELQQFVSQFS